MVDEARPTGEPAGAGPPRPHLFVRPRLPLAAALQRALGSGWLGADPSEAVSLLAEGGPPPRAVVYLARARCGPADPLEVARFLGECVRHGVPQIVMVTSTQIHEPSPNHPGMVGEAGLRTRRTGNPTAAAWRALEEAAGTTVPGGRLVLLRTAPVPQPGELDLWSRLVFSRVAWTALGYDPMVQLLAVEDLASAIMATVEQRLRGTFHVVPDGPAPARRAVRAAGALRVAVPLSLWRLGRRIAGRPLGELEAMRYPATVSGAKLAATAGFRPRYSTLQAPRRNRDEDAPAAPPCDEFGFDLRYRRRLGRTLFRFLHDFYWRVDVRGLQHIPRRRRAILVGVHRGFQPWDGVMIQQAIVDHCGRCPRFLLHPTLVKFPFLAPYMTKIGGLLASRENAEWVLQRDGLLGVYPEGIWGAFTPYRDAYRITPHFRPDFAELAIRHRAPIVPFVTIGSAEAFPILGRLDWDWCKRWTQWPFVPVTTPVPLPSKWHIEILSPLDPADRYSAADAADAEAVRTLAAEVRAMLETKLSDCVRRRRWRFFGALPEAP